MRIISSITGMYRPPPPRKPDISVAHITFLSNHSGERLDGNLADKTTSIFFYLMDPLGQFVDAFGKNTTADEVAAKTREAVAKWEKAGGNAAAGV
jgi:hypothetical protein